MILMSNAPRPMDTAVGRLTKSSNWTTSSAFLCRVPASLIWAVRRADGVRWLLRALTHWDKNPAKPLARYLALTSRSTGSVTKGQTNFKSFCDKRKLADSSLAVKTTTATPDSRMPFLMLLRRFTSFKFIPCVNKRTTGVTH